MVPEVCGVIKLIDEIIYRHLISWHPILKQRNPIFFIELDVRRGIRLENQSTAMWYTGTRFNVNDIEIL